MPYNNGTLLSHQLDFAKRSGVSRAIIIARPQDARLFWERLSETDRRFVSFVYASEPSGWAGDLSLATSHFDNNDEVLILPSDNIQSVHKVQWLDSDVYFTYATTTRHKATSACFVKLTGNKSWQLNKPNIEFSGQYFAGFIVSRGELLKEAMEITLKANSGEIAYTLAALAELSKKTTGMSCYAIATPRDIASIEDLAVACAFARGDAVDKTPSIGAGVVLGRSGEAGGEVALVERADGFGWVLPGGLSEPGEPFVDAAARECFEEAGVRVDAGQLRLLGVYPTAGKQGEPAATVVFWCAHRGLREGPLKSRETLSLKWFSEALLDTVQIPFGLRAALDDYYAGRELDYR